MIVSIVELSLSLSLSVSLSFSVCLFVSLSLCLSVCLSHQSLKNSNLVQTLLSVLLNGDVGLHCMYHKLLGGKILVSTPPLFSFTNSLSYPNKQLWLLRNNIPLALKICHKILSFEAIRSTMNKAAKWLLFHLLWQKNREKTKIQSEFLRGDVWWRTCTKNGSICV